MKFVSFAFVTNALTLLLTGVLFAAEASQEEFESVYALSQQELRTYRETGFLVGLLEPFPTVAVVTKAYQLGQQTVTDPLLLAELTADYGGVIRDSAAAEQLLKDSIALIQTYRDEHGDTEAQIRPLMSIAHLAYEFRGLTAGNSYYKRALRLADKYWKGELRLAGLYIEAGVQLSAHSHGVAQNYLEDALDIYAALEGDEAALGEATANMHLGRYWIRRVQYVRAERALEAGLAALGDQHDSATFVGLHTQLVRLYAQTHEPELAGKHSQIIGSTYVGQASDQLVPLYTVSPRYPPNAARLGIAGQVTLRFTVNELGEVTNPVVDERTGHHEFELAATEAVKRMRFAPRFVDGKAVPTENVRFTMLFDMRR